MVGPGQEIEEIAIPATICGLSEACKRGRNVLTEHTKRNAFSDHTAFAGICNRSKAAISGNIERQGLEGSLINRYAGGNVDRDVLYNVAKTSRDIALKNEMSKHTAPKELYNVGSADELRKYQNRVAYQQARTAGWDEAGSGIQTAIGAMDTGTMFNSEDELLKYLATIESSETANLILQMARKAHPEWFGD